jgi:hypothetical protein
MALPHDVSCSSGTTTLHVGPKIELNHSKRIVADNAWSKILSSRFSTTIENQLRLLFSDTQCLKQRSFTRLRKIILGLTLKDHETELETSKQEINQVYVN